VDDVAWGGPPGGVAWRRGGGVRGTVGAAASTATGAVPRGGLGGAAGRGAGAAQPGVAGSTGAATGRAARIRENERERKTEQRGRRPAAVLKTLFSAAVSGGRRK
jgi:hypothetical protein